MIFSNTLIGCYISPSNASLSLVLRKIGKGKIGQFVQRGWGWGRGKEKNGSKKRPQNGDAHVRTKASKVKGGVSKIKKIRPLRLGLGQGGVR